MRPSPDGSPLALHRPLRGSIDPGSVKNQCASLPTSTSPIRSAERLSRFAETVGLFVTAGRRFRGQGQRDVVLSRQVLGVTSDDGCAER